MTESKGNCDDQDSLLSPAFKISGDVKLKDVPTNGEEYLLKVMNERAKCAVVTKCNRDYSKFAKNQSCYVKVPPRVKAPDNIKPTIEWQNIQVADFSNIRMYVSRMRSKECNKIVKRTDSINWTKIIEESKPTLSLCLGICQSVLDEGLENLIEIIRKTQRGQSIDHRTGQWIYSLIACIQQPLFSDTASILRNLARKCIEVRSRINPAAENAWELGAPLNMIICLIGRYFGQYDLADV